MHTMEMVWVGGMTDGTYTTASEEGMEMSCSPEASWLLYARSLGMTAMQAGLAVLDFPT